MIIKKPSRLSPRGILAELLPTNFIKFQHPHHIWPGDTRRVKVPWDVDEDANRSISKVKNWKSKLLLRTQEAAAPAPGPNRHWCVVSGAWIGNGHVHPGHIFPRALGSNLMRRVTGNTAGIYAEESGLLLPKPVLEALTDWALVIVPDPQATCETRHPPPWAKPHRNQTKTPHEFQFRIIDAAHPAMPKMLYPPAPKGTSQLELSVAELDGHPLRFANRNRPILPVVYFHACCAIWKKTYLQLQDEKCDDLAEFRTRFLTNLTDVWGDKPSDKTSSEITPIFLVERQDTPRTHLFGRENPFEEFESEGHESEGQEIKVAPEEQVTNNPTPGENQAEVGDMVPADFFASAFKAANVPVSNRTLKKESKLAKKEEKKQRKLAAKEAKRASRKQKSLKRNEKIQARGAMKRGQPIAAGSYRLVLDAKKEPEDSWESLNKAAGLSVARTPGRRDNRAEEPKVAPAGSYRLVLDAKKEPGDPWESLNMAAGLSVARTPGRRDNRAEEPKVAPAAPFASLREDVASLDLWATFKNKAAKEVSVARTPEPRNNQAEEADKALEDSYASLGEAVKEAASGHQDPWATFKTAPAKEVPVTRHLSRGSNREAETAPANVRPKWALKVEKKKIAKYTSERTSFARESLERALLERASRLSGEPEAQHHPLPLAPKKRQTLPHANHNQSVRGKTNKIPVNWKKADKVRSAAHSRRTREA